MAQLGSCCSDSLGVVNDAVCFTVDLADTGGTEIVLWNDSTTFIINGTVMVENNGVTGVGPTASLTVNGVAVAGFVVEPGSARAITVNDINTIGIIGTGGAPLGSTSNVKISFSLNYKF
ncbi:MULTISPECIES: DUF3992 domain-containing protein [Priestia]|uniref:DUF3992 domain-containing protein n=1 Tax=Priestia TaxID=2800373 RepID=UPI0012B9D6DF|nr:MULTISPECIES: S-Ena type endospore appendage [Priestia]NER44792.1 DUF3992 domain-containing protein [Priestia megaterium NBRC 15308 = ATCC 14581]MBY0214918.1 DUF3992 domain-containing protein [Priestia aryabhattai]MCM2979035.1 DUF3992 domain-containing protein [Priestia aryabhattai]MED3950164.1 DUF3992 domain-containing protein [Priestia aryabhattai]NER44823.1 DUF3992 domain-containing protein [Priestia megaterium NBRC 15308 = ATCC 14581]